MIRLSFSMSTINTTETLPDRVIHFLEIDDFTDTNSMSIKPFKSL